MNRDEVRTKLERCFALTFPKLDRARIPSASATAMSEWDSVANISLLTLVGEEFGIEIDLEDFEDATSFAAIESRLSQMVQAA